MQNEPFSKSQFFRRDYFLCVFCTYVVQNGDFQLHFIFTRKNGF